MLFALHRSYERAACTGYSRWQGHSIFRRFSLEVIVPTSAVVVTDWTFSRRLPSPTLTSWRPPAASSAILSKSQRQHFSCLIHLLLFLWRILSTVTAALIASFSCRYSHSFPRNRSNGLVRTIAGKKSKWAWAAKIAAVSRARQYHQQRRKTYRSLIE